MPDSLLRLHAFLLATKTWARRSAADTLDRVPTAWRALHASQPYQDLEMAAVAWNGHDTAVQSFLNWLDTLALVPVDQARLEDELVLLVAPTVRSVLRPASKAA